MEAEAGARQAAVVTGASRGLGLLLARELARHGYGLVICARDPERLESAAAMLREDGAEVIPLATDITGPDAPARLVSAALGRFGRLDLLVNNAGIIQVGPAAVAGEEDYREAMETMFFAPLRLTLAALPELRRARGRIVNVTSVGGRIAAPHLLPYVAAKFAGTGYSEGLRAELAREGVSVTTVLPGLMRTGSHGAALFQGDQGAEYAWFATAASMPLLSTDAERAARTIVRAALRRRPEVVLTPAAKLGVRAAGLAPATTARLLAATARLLPGPDGRGEPQRSGAEVSHRLRSTVVDRLTTLGDRAAARFNQPRGHGAA